MHEGEGKKVLGKPPPPRNDDIHTMYPVCMGIEMMRLFSPLFSHRPAGRERVGDDATFGHKSSIMCMCTQRAEETLLDDRLTTVHCIRVASSGRISHYAIAPPLPKPTPCRRYPSSCIPPLRAARWSFLRKKATEISLFSLRT